MCRSASPIFVSIGEVLVVVDAEVGGALLVAVLADDGKCPAPAFLTIVVSVDHPVDSFSNERSHGDPPLVGKPPQRFGLMFGELNLSPDHCLHVSK